MTRDALTESEALTRCQRVANVSYALSLVIDGERPQYDGEATIRFQSTDPSSATFLDFTGGEIFECVVNGANYDLAPRHSHRIELPARLLESENEVRVRYRNDYDRTGSGFHRFQDPEDGEVYLYTDFEPYCAHRLFPCFDQPDLKATYDVDVTAPQAWVVVANGAEDRREAVGDGAIRRHFAQLDPFSTYLFAVIAGPYVSKHDTSGSVALGVYCRKSLERFFDHEEVFEITRQGFAFYTDYFDQPYPFGKYDQLFVPEYNSGAMENVGAVTFNESQVFRDPPTETQRLVRAEVILHELAHMWFGNLVTMKWWDGLWLNESFATYISFLAMSEATRFQDCWQNFLGSIKTWAYREDQKPTTHPIACTVDDTDQTFLNFDGITYGKGAAVLKQLRASLGATGFREGLRLYFRRHAWGNTTIGDFLGALSEGADKDLNHWSQRWLETSGVNTIQAVPSDNGSVLRQQPGNGDAVLRPHHLEVALYTHQNGALAAAESVTVALEGAEASLPVTATATAASVLWPNQDDHAYARVLLDDASLATVKSSLDKIDDPLVRMGLWCTFWEMVREGALPPSDHIALGARFLVNETRPEIVQTNLRLVTVSMRRYLPLGAQSAAGAVLMGAAKDACEHHPTGSDLQLLWGRAAPGFVADTHQARDLATWISGGAPGALPVDQGLRWRILSRMSAFALDGVADLLSAETGRDPSDRGVKARFAAEAAAPDLDVKRPLFERFVRPAPGDSADLLKAGMGSFFQPHQAASASEFGLRYFEVLSEVVREQELEYATRGFARLLVPHAIASPALIAAAEAALERARGTPILERVLLEETDEMARAVRLRASGAPQ